MLDIDNLRNPQIRLHGLVKADNRYTFYHDETNNIRKLYVGTQGLNVDTLKVFVLGGIVNEGVPHLIDIQSLRKALRIQKTAEEIKLKHVAKGEFLELLRSPQLTTFLRWIIDNRLMIHYHDIDPLYWSIVDIIDSILSGLGNSRWIPLHMQLKADLTAILRTHLPSTVSIFYRYGYPGITPENRKPLLNDIIALIENDRTTLPIFNACVLKGVLAAGRGLDCLDFIEGNAPNKLIDDFSIYYLNRLAVFKYSTHILDMEESIRGHFLKTPLTKDGKPVTHYRFADSKTEAGIQLSDIVVGVMGKMHSYFTETSSDDIASARTSLTGTSLQNAELLRDLIDASDAANIAFLHHVASAQDINKLNIFLRFLDNA